MTKTAIHMTTINTMAEDIITAHDLTASTPRTRIIHAIGTHLRDLDLNPSTHTRLRIRIRIEQKLA